MLTIAAVKSARPQSRAYKMFDASGLFLFVAPTGLKSWRLKYRFAGKEKLLTLGRFPELSLAAARRSRDQAKLRLRDGHDPASATVRSEFEPIARMWHRLQRPRWSPAHAQDVLSSLERDVFPVIGDRDIAAIHASDLLNIIGGIEQRGCLSSARRLRQRLSAIFRYAISQELCEKDPAALIDQAMMAVPLSRPQVALINIDDAKLLLRRTDELKVRASIRLASWFLALTATRLESVRGATWDEIEDLDGQEPLWRIPPSRMKLSQAKKQESRFEHIVPLSPQAVEILHFADSLFQPRVAAGPRLIFPGRDRQQPIGAGSIRSLYQRAGFGGQHVPHGWRATFSTVMNETMPESRAAIDLALAHAPKDKVEAAYNRSLMLEERRRIFDRWGEMLG